jgi:hypothetical protein
LSEQLEGNAILTLALRTLLRFALYFLPQLEREVVIDIIIIPVILPLLKRFFPFLFVIPLCNGSTKTKSKQN